MHAKVVNTITTTSNIIGWQFQSQIQALNARTYYSLVMDRRTSTDGRFFSISIYFFPYFDC